MIEIIISIIVILFVGFLIVKKFNATIALLIGGLILLIFAAILGHQILPQAKEGVKATLGVTSGNAFLDIFKIIEGLFLSNLGNIGLTIMTLFGYSAYMSVIKANDMTVEIMTKPLRKIKSKYVLIPIVFLLGNLMSLVVPSASSLGILLMSTMYPILIALDISPLATGAVIATTATIMPTPLGADNVIAAKTFDMNIVDYVIKHAKISIPALLIMAVAHYAWQKFLDKRDIKNGVDVKIDESKLINNSTEKLPPVYYAIFPLMPLIVVLIINLGFPNIKFGLVPITILCFVIAAIFELIRKYEIKTWSENIQVFFKGMGNGLAMVVSLLVAAGTLVEGLKILGVVDMITNSVKNMQGAGIIMILVFSLITLVIGLICGGGLSVFYATIALIPAIASAAGIAGYQIALPMQMVANLGRSISPVAAVIVIISSMMKVSPMQIIKRTSVPVFTGIIVCMILAFIV